ncbi:MAG: N-acetylmuramic acid 6-phosphate etherase [Saprospiraceae bacterium]|nr:N-acetylmuramic acid 6-phosphate etherase [Saprospiraceae bacterium]
MEKITEKDSLYRHLDKMSTNELLVSINIEDRKVPEAVAKAIPQIENAVNAIYFRLKNGGRLFYIGAGTSGRLGIVDASEIPPTFGAPYDLIIGIIAGGDRAIRRAVEWAEDDTEQAWKDMTEHGVDENDFVVGIAASGTTPYVIGGLKTAREKGLGTASISCNPDAPVSQHADFPIEVIVGPEFVTGSSRMKAGTAQKLVLNMITTSVMIKLGHVEDNKMVDMQITNVKLKDRGTKMIMKKTGLEDYDTAAGLLERYGSVRNAVKNYKSRKK